MPKLTLLCLLGLFALATSSIAQERTPLATAPDSVRKPMAAHDWSAAEAELDRLILRDDAADDHWLLLKATAQRAAGNLEAAESTLQLLEREHTASSWIHKSQFMRADIYRELRRYEDAVAIFESAALRIRSEERQAELASIYFDFADELSAELDPNLPAGGNRDFARAATLYRKVLELEAPAALRERATYRVAACLRELEQWNDAISAYDEYLAEFGGASDQSNSELMQADRTSEGRVLDARFELAQCKARSNKLREARRRFEDLAALADRYRTEKDGTLACAGQDTWCATRSEELVDLAARSLMAAGDTYGNRRIENELAIASYERLLSAYPKWNRGFEARFKIAQLHRASGHDEQALDAFTSYLASNNSTATDSGLREEDQRLRMRSLFLSGQILSGQRRYELARETFSHYVTRHANGPDWSAAQQSLLDCEYSQGLLQREEKQYEAARQTWSTFLDDHPLDSRAGSLLFDIGQLFLDEADGLDDPESKEARELWQAAIRSWQRVVKKYPGSDEASRALYHIGFTYEMKLVDFHEAIATYRSCKFGSHQYSSDVRLQEMADESLAVHTERTWRTDEEARIRITTRNIEELTIEIYALDLEAYFRKHLTHRQVEDLDLDLIATDHEITIPVEDYERFKLMQRDFVLPVDGPGVWAVVVVAGEQRSTTLVLQSDIDLIVKSSRTELFAYAQDMRQGKPAAGVEVLVGVPSSEGQQGVLQATTNEDGVARFQFDELQSADAMHVFAMQAGNFAANGISIHGLEVPTGLTPRGIAYTDRSAYKPGRGVHWRSIVREVQNGSFNFESGTEYDIRVVDSQGRTVYRSTASMSPFGTLTGSFFLSENAAYGQYTLSVTREKSAGASCQFLVEQYRLQKVELVLSPERDVYFRGETVEVDIEARHYYGAAVADSPLDISLPDGRELKARTDENGRARFTFETRDHHSENAMNFAVTLPEEHLSQSGSVWIAQRGFRAKVTTGRGVYLAGSPFTVNVATESPTGEPVSKELTLKVLRLEAGAFGSTSQVEVGSYTVTTAAETGTAAQSVQIVKGGIYQVRIEGIDRAKNIISDKKQLFISGDEDGIQLRFLTDVAKWNVGDSAKLELNSRAADGLALLTFEGEGILDYRIVKLVKGTNALDFVVDHEHFPNFAVTASMMEGNRFHTADVEFGVARKLNVTVETEGDSCVPGEVAKATIRVTDQLGRPVEAELSLAVVDEALFELYPDRSPSLASVFDAGTQRVARLRTVTSCEFEYAGVTRRISQAILAEQERILREREWKASREAVTTRLGKVSAGLVVMDSEEAEMDADVSSDSPLDNEAFNDVIGIGGGAGGKFGGRFGGRKNLRARGGSGSESSAPPTPGLDSDTAFWSSTIVTDANGEAAIEIAVPNKSTRWRLTCRGVGANTLLGETQATIVSKSNFFIELRTPDGLNERDKPQVMLRVHNLTGLEGECDVWLAIHPQNSFGVGRQERKIVLGAEPIVDVLFAAPDSLPAGGTVNVMAQAVFGEFRDHHHEALPVKPWGVERVVARSGTLTSRTVLEFALPDGGTYSSKTIELYVGIDLDNALIEAALGRTRPSRSGIDSARFATQADTASDLAGVCAVLDSMSSYGPHHPGLRPATNHSERPEYRDLQERAEGLAASLLSSQNSDGGWAWSGRASSSSVESSSRAMVALAYAEARGIAIDANVKAQGVRYLENSFRSAAQDADEAKSMLLHALALHGKDDFGAANRLHRNRYKLSPAALAYTALALIEMDRSPMAEEVATVLQEQAIFSAGSERTCHWATESNSHWNRSKLDMVALAVLALRGSQALEETRNAAEAYLLAHSPWKTRGSNGAILEALVQKGNFDRRHRNSLAVSVTIDGEQQWLELSAYAPGQLLTLDLPDERPANIRIELAQTGNHQTHYSAVLRGFDSNLSQLTPDKNDFRSTKHRYLTVPPTFEGREIPTGYSVLRNSRLKRVNEVANLPAGQRTRVEVEYKSLKNRGYEYAVLEVPIPAGCRVVEGTLQPAYGSSTVRDGVLTVFIGGRRTSGKLSFELLGANPGEYSVLPARISSALDPERYSYIPARPLTVLPSGTESPDAYEATPDELFYLGKAMYDAGELEGAFTRLSSLFEQFEKQLDLSKLQETASMLLQMSIERGAPAAIVRYFEVLKEKNPSLTIAFDKVLRVADAYRELREFERALLIYRAVVEETHGKDLKVAGTLREQDEFAGATDTLERLWLEYPDFPVALQTQLALTDMLLSKAPFAASDKSLRKAGRNRASLTTQGILMLKRFLSMYPESPLAPEAALNLVSAYLGLEDYETTAALAGEMASVYDEPKFKDAFLYTQAVAEWYLGHNEVGARYLQQIADAEYPTKSGATEPSENRDLALYILGQIRHAQRDFEGAAEYYERVADLFVDAKEALAGFNEKQLSVEEVTSARPGEPIAFELEYKNLEEVELLVYSVDLMTLYLREQNLSNITQVNLAGISPTLRQVVSLERTTNARSAKHTVQLELVNAGAYLVICRGEDRFSSGLVLVSDLELEVDEDPRSGRLRVQVLDVASGSYLRDVDVRVVGSSDGAFQSGETDPRGLFIADNVKGLATVIARSGDRQYAFHRGSQPLGARTDQPGQSQSDGVPYPQSALNPSFFSNVIGLNDENFRGQQEAFDKEVRKDRAGVQVLQVK